MTCGQTVRICTCCVRGVTVRMFLLMLHLVVLTDCLRQLQSPWVQELRGLDRFLSCLHRSSSSQTTRENCNTDKPYRQECHARSLFGGSLRRTNMIQTTQEDFVEYLHTLQLVDNRITLFDQVFPLLEAVQEVADVELQSGF